MKQFFIAYAGVLIAFLILDAIWIGIVAKNFYISQMGNLLTDNPRILPAAAFYLVYCAIIVYLVILPNSEKNQFLNILIGGGLFGLAAYGAYNMTNLSIIQNWPVLASFVDLTWGVFVTATTALTGYMTLRFFISDT